MAHTYMLFDFGSDEEKAQQARHKLEGWKQAFRLDKKLQYKLDRGEPNAEESAASKPAEETAESAASSKSAKSPTKSAKPAKSGAKSQSKSKSKAEEEASETPASNGKVSLLVRLYFSGHEKLTEQRWLDRIPNEEPFKAASPRVIRQGESQFDELIQQFEALE